METPFVWTTFEVHLDCSLSAEVSSHLSTLQWELIKSVVEDCDEVVPVLVTPGVLVCHEGGDHCLEMNPPQLHVPLQSSGTLT